MDPPPSTEAELESFRQKWREEVSARARNTASNSRDSPPYISSSRQGQDRRKPPTGSNSAGPTRDDDHHEDYEARTYHDLPDKEAELRLNAAEQGLVRGSSAKEPKSALEHYEKAVERETQGSLGDSLKLYRKAFKVCFVPPNCVV